MDQPLTSQLVETVEFPKATRVSPGYRMSDVDAFLLQVAARLRELEAGSGQDVEAAPEQDPTPSHPTPSASDVAKDECIRELEAQVAQLTGDLEAAEARTAHADSDPVTASVALLSHAHDTAEKVIAEAKAAGDALSAAARADAQRHRDAARDDARATKFDAQREAEALLQEAEVVASAARRRAQKIVEDATASNAGLEADNQRLRELGEQMRQDVLSVLDATRSAVSDIAGIAPEALEAVQDSVYDDGQDQGDEDEEGTDETDQDEAPALLLLAADATEPAPQLLAADSDDTDAQSATRGGYGD